MTTLQFVNAFVNVCAIVELCKEIKNGTNYTMDTQRVPKEKIQRS